VFTACSLTDSISQPEYPRYLIIVVNDRKNLLCEEFVH